MVKRASLVWFPLVLLAAAVSAACESEASEPTPTGVRVTSSTSLVDVLTTTSTAVPLVVTTTAVPVSEPEQVADGLDEVNVGEGDITVDAATARFCGLAFESIDLMTESYSASELEPFDRDQARLVSAMSDVVPDGLANLVSEVSESYGQLIKQLDGYSSTSRNERDDFLESHLDLTSQLQLALFQHVDAECSRMSTDRHFVASVLAGDLEAEVELAAPAPEADVELASPAPEAAAPSDGGEATASATFDLDRGSPAPTGGGDSSNMPIAAGSDYPFDTPELPTPVPHGVTPGYYILASTSWEETDVRVGVDFQIYMRVSDVDIVIGTRCDADDYHRRNEIAIDSSQTHQTAFGPTSFTMFCGLEENGTFGGFGGHLYHAERLGWRQHNASVSATFVERGTGLTASLEATVNFADYR